MVEGPRVGLAGLTWRAGNPPGLDVPAEGHDGI